jgi:hypothetical protein
MSDDNDLDLYQTKASEIDPGPSPGGGPSPWPVILGLVVLVAGALAFYWLRPHRAEAPASPAASAPAAPPAAPPRAAAPDLETTLPPLDESDAAVREIVGSVSTAPLLATWLGGSQLLRGATQVLVSIADGHSLPSFVGRFAPQGSFAVRTSEGRTVIDPASYRRYDAVGAAAASIDPARAAAAYRTLRPRLDEAYRELGMAGSIDDLVIRAAGQVLAVPLVEREIPVVPKGIVYAYADPRLEALPPTSKLLLRMGPDTVRRVQTLAREFTAAVGTTP